MPFQDTPVMQMSYDDPYSIIDLVKSAKCIINVAGPYMLTQGELMKLDLFGYIRLRHAEHYGSTRKGSFAKLVDLHAKSCNLQCFPKDRLLHYTRCPLL